MVMRNGSVTVSKITHPRDAVEEKHGTAVNGENQVHQRTADAESGKTISNLKTDPGKGSTRQSAEILKDQYKDLKNSPGKYPYSRLIAAKRPAATSRTSNAVIARHLAGSRSDRLKKSLLKRYREFPPFQELLLSPATFRFTAETMEELEWYIHDHADRLLSRSDATAWQTLQKYISIQEPIAGKTDRNSDYHNTKVSLKDLRHWIDFPTFDTIEKFSKSIPQLKHLFHEVLIDNAARGKWFEEVFKDPGYFPSNEESSLSRNLQPFFAELSALLRIACVGFPNAESTGGGGVAPDSNWVTFGGGKCAMKRRSTGTPKDPEKIPDLVAYWTNGDYTHLKPTRGQPGFPANQTQCLIVGDYKMATKFEYAMLLRAMDKPLLEVQRVMNQIHDYMDMSNNKYGYVITQTELIMFRRRDSPAGKWGQLDFSPPIPVSSKKGTINAMMVLWYFHVRYAVMGWDEGWKLESCYVNYPENMRGESVSVALDKEAGTFTEGEP